MNFIIKNYFYSLKNEDIVRFALENGIDLNEEEAKYIYGTIKDNMDSLLNGNESNILKDINSKIGKEKGEKIIKLFYEYKEKYKDYL